MNITYKEPFQQIPLEQLHPFQNHPFKVIDDDLMMRTVESIQNIGIAEPLIVRPDPEGGYEILSGHRRCRAAQLAGLASVPAIVKDISDEEAIIVMVDSNLQREEILPSERAKAYRMKLDAMKRQAGRPSKENASQVGTHKRSDQIMAEELNTSRTQIQRYIRLTHLIPELLDMVDRKKIAFNPAVELSYLKPREQKMFLDAMEYGAAAPSLSQAQRIRKLSQAGKCTQLAMYKIMNEEKKSSMDQVVLQYDVLRKYFPESYTPKQMQDTIIQVLEEWCQRHRSKSNHL